jgi:hypothetical protein
MLLWKGRVRWVPCHHGIAHPQVAEGGDGFQIWKIAMNILNKESRRAEKDRYYRVLTMVYSTQRYWVFGLCPSSGLFLNNSEKTHCYLGKIRTMDKIRKPNISDQKRGVPPASGLGVGLKLLTVKYKLVTKDHKKPPKWADSLDKRPKRKKLDMRFGTWNIWLWIGTSGGLL